MCFIFSRFRVPSTPRTPNETLLRLLLVSLYDRSTDACHPPFQRQTPVRQNVTIYIVANGRVHSDTVRCIVETQRHFANHPQYDLHFKIDGSSDLPQVAVACRVALHF